MQAYILFFELLSFWCSLSRQEAWKGCIQYKCFICKTICRAEERRKSSCKPQKKNLKENASEKSRFLQKCTFYCFSSLSLFAGINQSIIKPFPTMIRWNHQLSINQARVSEDIIISTQRNCKIMTSSEEEAKKGDAHCPGQVDDGWKTPFGLSPACRYEGYHLLKGHTTQGDFKLISSS